MKFKLAVDARQAKPGELPCIGGIYTKPPENGWILSLDGQPFAVIGPKQMEEHSEPQQAVKSNAKPNQTGDKKGHEAAAAASKPRLARKSTARGKDGS